MQWTKPDFDEISLSMEVTAYANTDGQLTLPLESRDSDQVRIVKSADDRVG